MRVATSRVYPEVRNLPVTRDVEALRGGGKWTGRDDETCCPQGYGGSRAGSLAAGTPKKGKVKKDGSLKGPERMVPFSSTSENLIAFESVSTPLGRRAGVVGERIKEEGVGEGLDSSVTPGTPGIMMVDETRRSTKSPSN